ncbi:hypothetical protein ACQ4LE_003528 [Meloidogyne hapla]|uniref:Thiamine diphosphokinase n=1 Tax=Meloidogyne hapla TaxID=6305 RepID=A0A1I8BKP9_MELHA
MISRLFKPFEFVRQSADQLAVIAVDGPKTVLPNEWFTIWNSAKFRLCTDGAANSLVETCKSTKTKNPDMVVGDFDSITEDSKKYFESQKDCQVLKIDDQNTTDLTKTIGALMQKAGSGFFGDKPLAAILVLGGLTGRFDHVMGTLNAMMLQIQTVPSIPIYLLDDTNVVMIVQQSDTNIELLEEPITGTCGLIPLVQRRTLVTTEGFKWELKETKLDYGHCVSSSNKIAKPQQLRIRSSEPIVFTFELKRSFGLV